MKLTLPYPPSVNHLWRMHRGQMILSKEARIYRDNAQAAVVEQVGFLQPATYRCIMYIVVYPPDHRLRDLDNLLKAIQDSCRYARVYVDDSQIDKLTIERGHVSECPRVEVTVEELTP